MSSPVVSMTITACVLNASSNILAQLIKIYKTPGATYTIEWTPVFQFILFTALNCPPNFLWQTYLESVFPSTITTPSKSAVSAASSNNEKELDREEETHEIVETKLNIPNTISKFVLDQTVGAAVNTILFSAAFAGFAGLGVQDSISVAKAEFWPLMLAGWKLWPFVSFLNYVVIKSVQGRTLVGLLAGVVWGIYLSLAKS